jgi:site-specific recombinase XerD
MHSTILDFLNHYQISRGCSPHTISSYKYTLEDFQKIIGEKFPCHVGRVEVRTYLAYLRNKNVSSATIWARLACLRSFFRYLRIYKNASENPLNGISGPKKIYPLTKCPNQKEVAYFLDTINTRTLAGKRDKAIFELIYSTGMRVAECVNIRKGDIYLADGGYQVKIHGKRKKDRINPVGRIAMDAIKEYLKRAPVSAGEFVFRNLRGGKISTRSVERLFEKRFGKTDFSVHSLRHAFATHIMENAALEPDKGKKCNLRIIQDLLGHSDLGTTQRYYHVNKVSLIQQYHDAMDPINNKRDQTNLFPVNSDV